MKFLKWFLFSLCLIFVVLVAVFYANKIQENRLLSLQNWIHNYLSWLKQLDTISMNYQKDIDLWAKIIPNVVNPDIINNVEDRYIYSFSGYVSAWIDFSKLVVTGVVVERWLIANVYLPKSEILRTSVAYVPQLINGNIAQNDPKLLEKATAQAMQDMRDAATSQNILELAKVNAEKKVKEELLTNFSNLKDVVFK